MASSEPGLGLMVPDWLHTAEDKINSINNMGTEGTRFSARPGAPASTPVCWHYKAKF